MEKRTTLPENGLIWFGAGVSIAEIITGTYYASMGFSKAVAAILAGHLIGCGLLFVAGITGGKYRLSAMESSKMSFGAVGGKFFALMNIVQLVGWTSIMIYDGAMAAGEIMNTGKWLWCIITGALIVLWIKIGIGSLGKLNAAVMTALFLMTVMMSVIIFRNGSEAGVGLSGALSFGAAVELAAAMPLSWLPLISDYTSKAEKPAAASGVSAVIYGLVSCWMYVIGMGAAMITGESDIPGILLKAGLGTVGLLIIVLSTVTTTYLDAVSAGISAVSVWDKINGKKAAIASALIGTVAAVMFSMDDITGFLYFIGSVFAPMVSIQIANTLILKKDRRNERICMRNMLVWLAGFIIYRLMMNLELPVGYTLPVMMITAALCLITEKISEKLNKPAVLR